MLVGAEGGNGFLGFLGRSLRAAVLGPFVRYKTITVPIERTFALAKAADAIQHLEVGRARGKVVVTVP